MGHTRHHVAQRARDPVVCSPTNVPMPICDLKNWQAVIPKDDELLKRELLRPFLSYLGIEPKLG